MQDDNPTATQLSDTRERWSTLAGLEAWLETPMLMLSFVWLLLVLVELVWGTLGLLEVFGTAIWIAFLLEFAVRLTLAPEKASFLRRNWLTVIALAVPAFRLFRAFRVLRLVQATRGLRLVGIVGTANRSMNALGASLGRRGLGYVLAVTLLVILLGAAGMLAFEPAPEVEGGFTSYWDALWWTAMLVTTMGSQFWPHTVEGRILCFLLSLYGLAVFGYITASLASFFVGRDVSHRDGPPAAPPSDLARLAEEIAGLRREVTSLRLSAGEAADAALKPPGTPASSRR